MAEKYLERTARKACSSLMSTVSLDEEAAKTRLMEQPQDLSEVQVMQPDLQWLPPPFGAFAVSLTESTQAPPDFALTGILGVLAICNGGKYETIVNPSHREPTNLFTLIVGPPGERKSAVINELMRPIESWEKNENEVRASEIARSQAEYSLMLRRKKVLEDTASKIDSVQGGTVNKAIQAEADLYKLAQDIEAYREIRAVKIVDDDITPEVVPKRLAENRGRMAIVSSEGNVFNSMRGQYSKKDNMECFLKGHSGDPIRVERIGRAPQHIPNPALSMLIGIQPVVIQDIVSDKNLAGKGMIDRFLVSFPQSMVGRRKFTSCGVNEELKAEYAVAVTKLLDRARDIPSPISLVLSPEAHDELEYWFTEIETMFRSDQLSGLEGFASKLVGQTVRISANLHIALHPDDAGDIQIEHATMENAVQIARYYLSQARKTYSAAADSCVEKAKYVISRLRSLGSTDFISKRELQRLCTRLTLEELNSTIWQLIEFGYLAPDNNRTGRGRPSERLLINHHIYKK